LAGFVDAMLADNFFEGSNDVRSGWKFFFTNAFLEFLDFFNDEFYIWLKYRKSGIKRKISSILKIQQIPAHLHGWQREMMKFSHEWNSMPIYFICMFFVRNPRGQKNLHFFKSNKGQIWVPNTYVFNDVWLNFVLFFKQKNDAVTWSLWILNSDKKKEEFFLSEKFA
jgi:hypothetical protein